MSDSSPQDTLKSATDKVTPNTNPSAFDAQGTVGKQFTADGTLGGTAQKIGGPFDKEGAVGKHFNEDGAIGGTVQDKLGGKS